MIHLQPEPNSLFTLRMPKVMIRKLKQIALRTYNGVQGKTSMLSLAVMADFVREWEAKNGQITFDDIPQQPSETASQIV